jgi:hypothetical protein
MTRILWRLDGMSQKPNREGWQQGVTLHLLFQSLTMSIVRRDGMNRRYLVLEGCPHCRFDGCDRVCHRVLFEQLVRTTLSGVALVPTRRLVASASESRHVVAVPFRADAQLLDSAFLRQWSAGRILTTWSCLRATPQPITVGALLAVSADGPPPARALQPAGWRSLPLASIVARRALRAESPQPVRVGVRAGEALLQAVRDPRILFGMPAATNPCDNEKGSAGHADEEAGAEFAPLSTREA